MPRLNAPTSSSIAMLSTYASNSFRRAILSPTRMHQLTPAKFTLNYSTHKSATHKEVSPHIGFYKTFTRPVAKVLLMATFFYQLAYWAWVKLEKDEVKADTEVELAVMHRKLEAQVAKLK